METTNLHAIATLLSQSDLLVECRNMPESPLPVTGADCDSRVVLPGHLFICKGAAFRPAYLTSALEAGAVGYVCDAQTAPKLATAVPNTAALVVNDIRRAMALVSAEAWGHPDRQMRVVGITGTKGKTTVAYFVRAMLDARSTSAADHAATIGTLETYDGVERFVSKNTTPEAPDLWRHLANAADRELDMVMEVSSQGLKYQRVEGVSFATAAFLNIGIDHVSPIEHPTFEDYLSSKLKLFASSKTAVLNAQLDPQHAGRIVAAARTCGEVRSFSLDGSTTWQVRPDVWGSHIRPATHGLGFVVHTPQWTAPAHIAMTGTFNVENALAAVAIAQELGCTREHILAGLEACRVPGRMDLIVADEGHLVAIVDYAHNGMSVEKVMSTVRESYPERYIVAVFGATGGKGAERRFEMPPAAAPYVDHLIFTEDDAGPEPVERICAQMAEATPAGTSCEVILDRTEAILHALELARRSDRDAVVCVLGKGHEARQLRADGPAPMVPDGDLVRQLVG